MNLSPRDRINYFKGILHLNIGKNNAQEFDEVNIRKWIDILKFDQEFFDFAVRNFIVNKVVIEDPPVFSCQEVARIFIRDCMRIAGQGKTVQAETEAGIYQVLKKNHIDEK